MANYCYSEQNGHSIQIIGDHVYIDNQLVKDIPISTNGCSITQVNGRTFINGYENKNGKWRKTLRGLFHKWFD